MSEPGNIAREGVAEDATADVLAQISDALRGLQFGVISITVQDGVVVQLERTEKRRIRRLESPGRNGTK